MLYIISEVGSFGTLSHDLLNVLLNVPGSKFVWASTEFVFPLSSHDILAVSDYPFSITSELPNFGCTDPI